MAQHRRGGRSSGRGASGSGVTSDHAVERVVVHDFSGHPFQVQLARELARRGIVTTHVYCPSFLTPKGKVDDDSAAAGTFRSVAVALRRPFAKYSGFRRVLQELEYGWRVTRAVRRERPDVVISANTPLLAALVFHIGLKLSRVPVVFWQQDVYSVAMAGHFSSRFGRVGRIIGRGFVMVEQLLLRTSGHVVVISADFLDTLGSWKVDSAAVTVIENWAPLDELPPRDRPNPWSVAHGIGDDDVVLLYAGTLGLKHEPSVLLDLARGFSDRPDVRVVVASEGIGAEWLAEHRRDTDHLQLLPFQPYEDLPDMLASADVLLVLLEADAGTFSVPSKVLTYHCAGRALLGAMPEENLASRNIVRTGSGLVVAPGDGAALLAAARKLVDDRELRVEMGRVARDYAEVTFDIVDIADRFLVVLGAVGARH